MSLKVGGRVFPGVPFTEILLKIGVIFAAHGGVKNVNCDGKVDVK